jgi:anti-sigma B factor antagonist
MESGTSAGRLSNDSSSCKNTPVVLKQDGSPDPLGDGAKARIAFSRGKETQMQHDDGSNASSPEMSGKPAAIKSKREGDSLTVAVAGEIDLSTAAHLATAIRDAEQTEVNRIVVDLSAMSFVDSTGLSVLLEAIKRTRSDGNRLSFVPSKHEAVTRVLALTDTTEIFE